MKIQPIKRVSPSSDAPSNNLHSGNQRHNSSMNRRFATRKKSSNVTSDNNMAPVLQQESLKTPPNENEEEDEIGFVSHAAMENRLHGYCQTKLLMEQRKREWAKLQKEFGSIEQQTAKAGVSVISSHAVSKDQQQRSTTAENTHGRSRFKQDIQVLKSTKTSVFGQESLFKSHMGQDLDQEPLEALNLRKIRKVEKDISRCINIEKIMKMPIEKVNVGMQELIGRPQPQSN